MIWVPLFGLGVLLVAVLLRTWKSAETTAAMVFLNVFCTAWQIITHDLLPVYIFLAACVIGAGYLYIRGARMTEFIITCLIAINAANYGLFFFIGGASVHWLEVGNWLIFGIYCTSLTGVLDEHITRHIDDDIRPSVPLDHSRLSEGNVEDRKR